MFYGCTKLNYINLGNLNEASINSGHYTKMFYDVPINIVVCLNPSSQNIKSQLGSHCVTFYCSDNSLSFRQKLINGHCYNYFTENEILNYEYNGACYEVCPSGTYEFRKICYEKSTNLYICEVICNKEIPFEIREEQICKNFCGINSLENKSCLLKYKDQDINWNINLILILYLKI